ncbi:hypothetical protein UCRPC4_g02398 [Phaeomoniella chlamydospora]|uniref:Uncharacterized protein n=1 Tax=Phaeomoniella chlamydospora TaxID=158046 RepID=A0A0G2H721_PHACM|nr:hypothetical protein UCRPC4_g02398 [Phaeomoniella chlamydospora]
MRIRTSEDPTAECSTSRLGSRRLSMADDDPRLVWSKVPYEYWIGRLSSCLDRYRAMNIMDTDVENEPFDETDGVKRAFRELEACCASEGAFASFRNFQDTFHLVEKGQSIAPDTRTLWPQSKEARDSIVAARLGPSRGHEPSISTSALPSFMSGQMAFPTLARPTGTGGQLPRSRTMESFKSVADGLRKVTNFGVEDGPSRSSFKEDKKAFAGKGKISRGRSRVSGGRKTSGTGTATAGSGSSMRKSSADVFKRIVADGAAKVRRLRRNLGGSGSPIDEIIESSATFGSSEEWMTEEECLIGIAK